MFKRLIIATDLSEASDQVIANLGALDALGTKEIILVHAVEMASPVFSTVGYDYTSAVREDLARRVDVRLAKLREAVEKQGFKVTCELLYGPPGEAIASFAAKSGATMAVVGSRGASLAKNIVLGSSAADILRRMPIPILLKRLEVKDRSGLRHYRLICRDFAAHVLYATDFSDTASCGFQYVEALVRASQSMVTLFHVCPPNADAEQLAVARERLAALASQLEGAGAVKVQMRVAQGKPAEEIVKASRVLGISLLVMGTQGKSFVEEFFLGSDSQAVIRKTSIPILMIPPNLKSGNSLEPERLKTARREANTAAGNTIQ